MPIKGQALGETLSSGLLMALGIAAKTFILLVEYVLAAEKERKTSRFEALLDAARKPWRNNPLPTTRPQPSER